MIIFSFRPPKPAVGLSHACARLTKTPREGNEPMKTNHKLALAVLTGALIGFAGSKAIHAQQAKAPPGYIIYEADALLDIPNLQKYAEKVPETLAPFNHRFIVRGGKPEALEGETPQSIVVI